MTEQQHLLSGVRVLDFTQFVAGPIATRLMAEMGAEIIKVEMAPGGDNSRGMPNFRDGRSGYFVQHNLGKKSLCLDIRRPEALEILLELVERVDVLVENFSPGIIGRFGLGWDVVRRRNPTLIMCSVSAFGQQGPLSRLRGFDFIAQAYSGITSMIGNPDTAPAVVGAAIGDTGTGIMALAAINAALYARAKPGGAGQFLDIALIDFYFQSHEMNVQLASTSGGSTRLHRSGSYHNVVSPLGMFRCADGYVLIMCLGDQWNRLCRTMGRQELIDKPGFADNAQRLENNAQVIAAIEAWLADKTMEQALALLEEGGVPAAPILSVEQAMRHPHLLERRTVRTIEDPVFGSFQVPGMPLRFSNFPLRDPGRAPFLGEHNGEVLGRYLGYDQARVDGLTEAGVLKSERR